MRGRLRDCDRGGGIAAASSPAFGIWRRGTRRGDLLSRGSGGCGRAGCESTMMTSSSLSDEESCACDDGCCCCRLLLIGDARAIGASSLSLLGSSASLADDASADDGDDSSPEEEEESSCKRASAAFKESDKACLGGIFVFLSSQSQCGDREYR